MLSNSSKIGDHGRVYIQLCYEQELSSCTLNVETPGNPIRDERVIEAKYYCLTNSIFHSIDSEQLEMSELHVDVLPEKRLPLSQNFENLSKDYVFTFLVQSFKLENFWSNLLTELFKSNSACSVLTYRGHESQISTKSLGYLMPIGAQSCIILLPQSVYSKNSISSASNVLCHENNISSQSSSESLSDIYLDQRSAIDASSHISYSELISIDYQHKKLSVTNQDSLAKTNIQKQQCKTTANLSVTSRGKKMIAAMNDKKRQKICLSTNVNNTIQDANVSSNAKFGVTSLNKSISDSNPRRKTWESIRNKIKSADLMSKTISGVQYCDEYSDDERSFKSCKSGVSQYDSDCPKDIQSDTVSSMSTSDANKLNKTKQTANIFPSSEKEKNSFTNSATLINPVIDSQFNSCNVPSCNMISTPIDQCSSKSKIGLFDIVMMSSRASATEDVMPKNNSMGSLDSCKDQHSERLNEIDKLSLDGKEASTAGDLDIKSFDLFPMIDGIENSVALVIQSCIQNRSNIYCVGKELKDIHFELKGKRSKQFRKKTIKALAKTITKKQTNPLSVDIIIALFIILVHFIVSQYEFQDCAEPQNVSDDETTAISSCVDKIAIMLLSQNSISETVSKWLDVFPSRTSLNDSPSLRMVDIISSIHKNIGTRLSIFSEYCQQTDPCLFSSSSKFSSDCANEHDGQPSSVVSLAIPSVESDISALPVKESKKRSLPWRSQSIPLDVEKHLDDIKYPSTDVSHSNIDNKIQPASNMAQLTTMLASKPSLSSTFTGRRQLLLGHRMRMGSSKRIVYAPQTVRDFETIFTNRNSTREVSMKRKRVTLNHIQVQDKDPSVGVPVNKLNVLPFVSKETQGASINNDRSTPKLGFISSINQPNISMSPLAKQISKSIVMDTPYGKNFDFDRPIPRQRAKSSMDHSLFNSINYESNSERGFEGINLPDVHDSPNTSLRDIGIAGNSINVRSSGRSSWSNSTSSMTGDIFM